MACPVCGETRTSTLREIDSTLRTSGPTCPMMACASSGSTDALIGELGKSERMNSLLAALMRSASR